jgi:hypothetical protein
MRPERPLVVVRISLVDRATRSSRPLIEDAKDLVDEGANLQLRWGSGADDLDVTILLRVHAPVPYWPSFLPR